MDKPPTTNERWLALQGLLAVVHKGQTLDQVERNRPLTPLARELLYGCCRFYFSLAALVNAQFERGLRRKDEDLRDLLVLGAYQLHHTRIPAHAAVDTSVALVRKLKKGWAKGLVNATLRRLAQDQDLKQNPAQHPEPATSPSPLPTAELTPATTDHPQWLIERLCIAYPNDAAALMHANNQRAPMALRLNLAHQDSATSQQAMRDAGLSLRQGALPETLLLAKPSPAAQIPGYAQGQLSVQDVGAQFANACWSNRAQRGRLLDACAAPGGKLHHALERLNPRDFVALEFRPERLTALIAEAQRLGHGAHVSRYQLGDATQQDWWDGERFNQILLDAPCSGTGTMRRHPDIKLHLTDADMLQAQVDKQQALLTNLWQLLAADGELLYCTCSLLPEENDGVVAHFLAQHPEACAATLRLPSGAATQHGWQLTPLDADTDGFYYARLQRRPIVIATSSGDNTATSEQA